MYTRTESYPLAQVELLMEERPVTVEAAVSDTVPRSVLLGTDDPVMPDFLEQKRTVKQRGNTL